MVSAAHPNRWAAFQLWLPLRRVRRRSLSNDAKLVLLVARFHMFQQPTLTGGLLFSCGSRPAATAFGLGRSRSLTSDAKLQFLHDELGRLTKMKTTLPASSQGALEEAYVMIAQSVDL